MYRFVPKSAGLALTTLVTLTTLVACSTQLNQDSEAPRPAQQPSDSTTQSPNEPRRELEEIVVTGKHTAPATNQSLPASTMLQHALSKRRDTSGAEVFQLAESMADASVRTRLQPSTRYPAPTYQAQDRENYEATTTNGVHWVGQDPVSTFSVDVDTAAYANMRRQLNQGQLPNPDSIRVEELVNYFNYAYPRVADRKAPFGITTEIGPSPWNADRKLVHIGINGWQPDDSDGLPPSNLVFLIDVSGSMQAPNKIQLLKSAMKMMVRQLRPQDSVAIAVYAGAAGQVLAPTSGSDKASINAAIDNLTAGGSTNGAAGIQLAYQLARQNFKSEGVNRVLLATDGDFNVGTTDIGALEKLVEQERKSGVALTVLGFGTGNYNDHMMQKIAQIGNGNAAYIDTINEARKVLVEELGATLQIIAKDVKVQIEFNPALVETYRLIGYETRHLNREDFNNDKIDAGDIGAGHTVTAMYEITLADGTDSIADPLRYQTKAKRADHASELATVKLRYKRPDADRSQLIERQLHRNNVVEQVAQTSQNFQFAAAVAWLGQHLAGSDHVQNERIQDIIMLANSAKGQDPMGYRSEFVNLLRTVDALTVAEVNPLENNHG